MINFQNLYNAQVVFITQSHILMLRSARHLEASVHCVWGDLRVLAISMDLGEEMIAYKSYVKAAGPR